MKKLVIISGLSCLLIPTMSNADRLINLSTTKLKCNDYQVTKSSNINDIHKYCDVYDTDYDVDDGVKKVEINFYSTSPENDVECKFINNKLVKCKIDD